MAATFHFLRWTLAAILAAGVGVLIFLATLGVDIHIGSPWSR